MDAFDAWLQKWPKPLYIIVVVAFVVIAYVTMNITIPIYSDFAHAAATDPGMANFPKTAAALDWSALWMWFMPAFVGGVAIVLRLKQPDGAGKWRPY